MADKNFLGLGVVFKGVDEGFSKSVDQVIKKTTLAQQTLDEMQKGLDRMKETSFKAPDLDFGFDRGAFSKIDFDTTSIEKAVSSFDQIAKESKGVKVGFSSLGKEKDKLINNFGKLDSQLDKSDKKMQTTDKRSSFLKKSFKSLAGFMSPFNIVTNLEEVSGWLKTLARGADFNEATLQFDDLFQRMSLVFDPSGMKEFQKVALQGMGLGVSASDAATLAKGMAQFGISAKDATKVLPTMQEMVGILGMDADHVAQMFGSSLGKLQQSPEEVIGMTKQFSKMGRAFGFIDPLESMPEIIKMTVDSTFTLGKSIGQQAPAMALSIQKVAGGFTALGMTQKEATAASIGFAEKNMDMLEQLERMSVGMEFNDEVFTKFASTMVKVGAAGSEMEAITKFQEMGGDQKKVLEYLQNAYKEAEKSGSGMAKMFRFEMKDLFGKDVAQALTTRAEQVSDSMQKAGEKSKDLGSPEDAWKKQIKVMNSSLQVSDKINKSMEDLVKVVSELSKKEIKLAVNKDYQESLGEVARLVQEGNNAFIDLATTLKAGGLSGILKELDLAGSKFLSTLSAWGVLMGAVVVPAFGVFSKILKPILGFVGNLGSGFLSLFASTGEAATGFGKIIKFVKPLGKVFGKFLGPLGAIIGFINDIPQAIEDFQSGGILKGITTLLFGGDVKEGEGLDNVMNQMFKFSGIGMMLGGPIGAAIGAAVGGIIAFVKDGLTRGFGTVFGEIWQGIGEFVGKIVYHFQQVDWGAVGSFVMDGLKYVFIDLPVKLGVWLGDALPKAFGFLGGLFVDIFGGAIGGLAGVITWPVTQLRNFIFDTFSSLFPETAKTIGDFFATIKGYWSTFVNWMLEKVKSIPFVGKYLEGFEAGQGAVDKYVDMTLGNFLKGAEKGSKTGFGSPLESDTATNAKKIIESVSNKAATIVPQVKEKSSEIIPQVQEKSKPTITPSQPEAPKSMGVQKPLAMTTDVESSAVAKAIVTVGDTILQQLKAMGNSNVNVTLEGDVKKFMRVVNTNAQGAMSGALVVPG